MRYCSSDTKLEIHPFQRGLSVLDTEDFYVHRTLYLLVSKIKVHVTLITAFNWIKEETFLNEISEGSKGLPLIWLLTQITAQS
jgi:hypothetical protein